MSAPRPLPLDAAALDLLARVMSEQVEYALIAQAREAIRLRADATRYHDQRNEAMSMNDHLAHTLKDMTASHARLRAELDAAEARLARLRPLVRAAVELQKWMRTFGMVLAPREYEPEQHRKVVEAIDPSDRAWALDEPEVTT